MATQQALSNAVLGARKATTLQTGIGSTGTSIEGMRLTSTRSDMPDDSSGCHLKIFSSYCNRKQDSIPKSEAQLGHRGSRTASRRNVVGRVRQGYGGNLLSDQVSGWVGGRSSEALIGQSV